MSASSLTSGRVRRFAPATPLSHQPQSPLHRAFCASLLLVFVASCGSPATPTHDASTIEIAPASLSMKVGAAQPLSARVLDESGTPLEGAEVFWSSEHPGIATVTPQGIVTAVSQGQTQIAASRNGTSALAPVSVARLPVTLVRVNPATTDALMGYTVKLTAQALDATGAVVPGLPATWKSGNPAIATVQANGLVNGIALGTVAITATVAGLNGSAVVTVRPPPVATVTVSPAKATVGRIKSVQLSATLRDANAKVLTGRAITWSAQPANVAAVSTSGRVTGLKRGTTTITATSEGKSGTAHITVR